MSSATDSQTATHTCDRYSAIFSGSVLYTMSMIVPFTIPVLMGLVAEQWKVTGIQLGLWAALFSLGLGIVAISSCIWVRRVNWKKCTLAGLILIGVSIGLHSIATNFAQLLILMFLAGCGAGLASAPTITALGDSSNPQRNFGIMIFMTVVIPALIIGAIALAASHGGYAGSFLMVASFVLVSSILVIILPSSGKMKSSSTQQERVRELIGSMVSDTRVLMAMSSMLIFVMGFMGAWSFFERIGNQSGLEQEPMLIGIALGQLIGGLGGFLAIWIGRYLGLRWSFLVAISVVIATLLSMEIIGVTLIVYIVIVSIFMLWINVNFSNIMSFTASIDHQGRFVSMLPGFQALGSFIGSIVAGVAFEMSGRTGVVVTSVIAFLICAICMLKAFQLSSKNELKLQPGCEA